MGQPASAVRGWPPAATARFSASVVVRPTHATVFARRAAWVSPAARPSVARGVASAGGTIGSTRLKTRFYIDPATGLLHIYNHRVDEDEVMEVIGKPAEDRAGSEGSRIALGQTSSGRYLRVIYVPDPDPDSVFVVTAYEMAGKSLAAFPRRRKKRQQ